MKRNRLEISKSDICQHGIPPIHCSTCQMIAFMFCNRWLKLPKDICRFILLPFVRRTNLYTVDFRYAADTEDLGYNGDDIDNLYIGMVVKDKKIDDRNDDERRESGVPERDSRVRPSQEFQDLKKLRVIFVGNLESYMGFLSC